MAEKVVILSHGAMLLAPEDYSSQLAWSLNNRTGALVEDIGRRMHQ